LAEVAAWEMLVVISVMRVVASGPGRARELVRMKKPDGERVSSVVRVGISQTVRTGMSSALC
tara:strand:- start:546 stop:731 length:186 start_codon:yes stop_codon:yes gene_type:complete